MSRPMLVAGNWKLHKTHEEIPAFFDSLEAELSGVDLALFDLAIFPSAMLLPAVSEALRAVSTMSVQYGPQNVYSELSGAFTGENSILQAKALGSELVLLGHSERRHVFGESESLIRQKVELALNEGMHVVLCLGENLAQREAGQTDELIVRQLRSATEGLRVSAKNLTLAYEPVWAIGTGKVATPEQVNAAHGTLRAACEDQGTRILYGGSVKPDNAAELAALPDVDGFLVGGASLKPKDFSKIVLEAIAGR